MPRTARFVLQFLLIVWAVVGGSPAVAQGYPTKPVRIILPYPPGGSSDPLVRAIAQKLSERFKVQFVVENRPGANGIIGTELGAKAPPDGYTIVFGSTSTLPMNAAVYKKLPYEPLKDFAFISTFSTSPLVLVVHPSVPARSVREFIALAKARPGQIVYASFGVGSVSHFGAELFSHLAGVRMLHVPYKGSGPSTIDLLAGHVMACFDSMQNAMPYIRAGRFRALGIASRQRSKVAPEIPTIAESGVPDFEVGTTFGLMLQAAAPKAIVTRLNAEMMKVLEQPDITNMLTSVGSEVRPSTPEGFEALMREELGKWTKVAREAGIRAD